MMFAKMDELRIVKRNIDIRINRLKGSFEHIVFAFKREIIAIQNTKSENQENREYSESIDGEINEEITIVERDLSVLCNLFCVGLYSLVESALKELGNHLMNNLGFSVNEFDIHKKDVLKLCEGVKNAGYALETINASENTVDWLNGILRLPNLYEEIIAKKPELALKDDIKRLARHTEKERKQTFENLNKNEQTAIKMLNRLIIELAYPDDTPKSLYNMYTWDDFKKTGYKGYKVALAEIPKYRELNIIRLINNCVKHSEGMISKKLQSASNYFFIRGEELKIEPDLVLSYFTNAKEFLYALVDKLTSMGIYA